MRTTLKIVLPLIVSVSAVSLLFAAYQVRTDSRGLRNDDVDGDVFATVRTVFDRGLSADRQLSFDFRIAIDQELHGVHILVFQDLKGEGCVSDG